MYYLKILCVEIKKDKKKKNSCLEIKKKKIKINIY